MGSYFRPLVELVWVRNCHMKQKTVQTTANVVNTHAVVYVLVIGGICINSCWKDCAIVTSCLPHEAFKLLSCVIVFTGSSTHPKRACAVVNATSVLLPEQRVRWWLILFRKILHHLDITIIGNAYLVKDCILSYLISSGLPEYKYI